MLIGKECNNCAILAVLESALALLSSGMTILHMIRGIQTVSLAWQAVFSAFFLLTKLLLKYFSHSTEETEFGLLLQEATALYISHVFPMLILSSDIWEKNKTEYCTWHC